MRASCAGFRSLIALALNVATADLTSAHGPDILFVHPTEAPDLVQLDAFAGGPQFVVLPEIAGRSHVYQLVTVFMLSLTSTTIALLAEYS